MVLIERNCQPADSRGGGVNGSGKAPDKGFIANEISVRANTMGEKSGERVGIVT